ncbi:sulfite exporter TauE/SafE family protein [Agromyces indicus]|uniref:Probable membrane transporter protein n=1 Tax=Agromyces indicus TaxID=758919 RepID=A0ABU1FHR5_9MICO|nr:sulfite exporter TauE/SafE family protein [Agromyces indicus]MDR5691294.1 sulfite exporter TauE/SafE family protein [Agromyces indicus]
MPEFTALEWLVLAIAACAVGLSKSGIPAFGPIPTALFAAVLPARASTGAVLGLLLVGDLIAVRMYHAHADWGVLRQLVPSVVVGVLLGVVVLWYADDTAVRRIIGAILVLLVVLRLGLIGRQRRSGSEARPIARGWGHVFGPLGGFTTMIANAAGPVMSLYFVASRLPVQAVLGTAAWFFLVVNAFKVPFSVGLGLMTTESLLLNLVLVPALVVGALVGWRIARRISATWFERIVLVLTFASGVYLLVV